MRRESSIKLRNKQELDAYTKFDELFLPYFRNRMGARPGEFFRIKNFDVVVEDSCSVTQLIQQLETLASENGLSTDNMYIYESDYGIQIYAWAEMDEKQQKYFITLKERELARKAKAREKQVQIREKQKQKKEEDKRKLYEKLRAEFEKDNVQ